jgi:hypothetical protein
LAKLVGKNERQVAQTLLLLESPKPSREAPEKPSLNRELAALEHHLSSALGLEVEMMTEGQQGNMKISYANIEQLEWLVRHLSSIGAHCEPEPTRPGLAA